MEEVKRIAQLLIPDASASFQALIYISSSPVSLLPTRLFSAPLGGGTGTETRCVTLFPTPTRPVHEPAVQPCTRAAGRGTPLAPEPASSAHSTAGGGVAGGAGRAARHGGGWSINHRPGGNCHRY